MPSAPARPIVTAIVLVTVALEVASVGLVVGVAPVGQPLLFAGSGILQAGAGAIIVWNYPRHPIGWLLVVFTFFNALCSDAALSYGLRGHHEGWPGATYVEILSLTSWVVACLGLDLLFLLLPDGRFLSRDWRWVPVVWFFGAVLAIPGWVLTPRLGGTLKGGVNPLAVDGSWVGPAFAVGTVLLCLSLVASVVALVVRFRRSRGVERLQLKWVMLAGTVLVIVLPASAALWTAWPPIQYFPAVALPLLPLAVCVAIVRHNLYDIDLVISRTVAYGALTGVLGLTYAAVVLAVGAVLSSPAAAATAALVVAVAFWPIRSRIQDAVDRRFRRARHESRRVMAEYVERLRRGEAGSVTVEDALCRAAHDDALTLGFRSGGVTYDVHGRPHELGSEPGRVITPIPTGQHVVTLVRHREADSRLVLEVVDAGRLALEIASLQVELRRRLEELEISRSRIVAVADEERRRLARDLHDGAQQRLVSIGLDLRHVQHALNGTAPAEVDGTLNGAVAELSNAIDDLRGLAAGLRPASLDQGLGSALRELAARSPIPVEVQGVPDRFPSELEAAAYFIACEGLTNAVKHAAANRVVLRFDREQRHLMLAISDDGRGGADARRGSGLLGLIDRARAHGGSLTIDSAAGTGTQLTARLPCG
jgi:signal transduction histidine kinase